MIDIASHEYDIRGAVSRPGARDAEVVWQSAGWLLTRCGPPFPCEWRWRTPSSGPGRTTGQNDIAPNTQPFDYRRARSICCRRFQLLNEVESTIADDEAFDFLAILA